MTTDFTSSALIGHLVASGLLATLAAKQIISFEDAHELCEGALLRLETEQAAFPENDAAFSEAREFLEAHARFFAQRK